MPRPLTEYRMQLNNLLQANGGAGRLRWGIPINLGTDHRPIWSIVAYFDGVEFTQCTGDTLDLAKEKAAGIILKHLDPSFTH